MDISFMTVLKLFYFICSSFSIVAAAGNLGLCSDPFCGEPFGTGLTTNSYNADDPRKLSFLPNQHVDIFVKEYGEKKNLYGVSLKGKKGFIPKTFVRETSTFNRKLVPALINFGDEPSTVFNQESQISNQDVHNQIPDTAAFQDQTFQEHSFKPSESLVSSENLYNFPSAQVQPPSGSEAYLFSQFAYQQASPQLTHPPQQSLDASIPTNNEQQFSGSETPYSPPLQSGYIDTNQHSYPSDMGNTAHQVHASDVSNTAHQYFEPDVSHTAHHNYAADLSNTAHQQQVPNLGNAAHHNYASDVDNTPQQHHFSYVGTTAQQHHVSDAESSNPSQNSLVPNTEIHGHHSADLEQMSSQFNLPEQQYDQLTPENTPDQNNFHYIQGSIPTQSFGSPSVSSSPSSTFSGEASGPGIKVNDPFSNYLQSDSAIPNVASETKQSADPFINQDNLGNIVKKPPINPPHNHKITDENDQFQDTMYLIEQLGYDTNEFNNDYYSDTSSDHPNLDSNSVNFQQNKEVSSFQPKADENHGTVHQEISQTSVLYTDLKHSASLEPSFQSSSTQLKDDYSAEKTSSVVEQQKSDISGVTPIDENSENDLDDDDEGDDDEVEIEDESDDLGTETLLKDNIENVIENDQKPESKLQPDETLNLDISSHIIKSALPTEAQNSNAYKSNKQLNVYTTVENASTVSDASISQHEFHPPPTEFNENDSIADEFSPKSNEASKNSTADEFHPKSNEASKKSIADEFPTKSNEANKNSTAEGLEDQLPSYIELKENLTVQTENENITHNVLNPEVANNNLTLQEDITLKEEINVTPNITEEKSVEAQNLSVDSSEKIFDRNAVETDYLSQKEQEVLETIMNNVESSKDDDLSNLNPYQIRNLKEDQDSKNSENVESSDEKGDNVTYPEDDEYSTLENSLEAIRSFIEELLAWIPEPFYSMIMDLENKGISPRVPVFTALCSVPCILLIIVFVFIKEKSKEKNLTVQLAHTEKNIFTLSAEKNALEEKLEKTVAEFESTKSVLEEERKTFDSKTTEVVSLKQQLEKANFELESNLDEINTLKEREKDYRELVKDHEKIHFDLMEEKSSIEKKVADQEDEINNLSDKLEEKENEITSLQNELEKFKLSNEDYEDKLNQLQTNCNQLLKEAEVWNMRVNELNSKLSEESSAKEELQNSLDLKDAEVKSLSNLVQTFKSFEEIYSDNEDENKSNEEKLKSLIDSSSLLIKLQKQEEESKLLSDKLLAEKDKVLEMEVGLLDSKSEIDKLKVNYNQALQDKTEATTKLEVLTNYFKDKELMLQKQLGVQEAFREKREKDADSAERQIVLIEQENTSYKYQVASMKQEMEETERNLKTQIATQEKKAHENWIAARAAERKLEDMKQEVTQLRQRLTLLEREQENLVNSSRDDIIRPIPKRISGMNDESTNGQDMNNSIDPRHIFPPPPPMMLPPDRPLPPLPPLPPFLPPMDPPPFRHQPWHHMDPPDFRMTPPDFMRGREVTPPRGRPSAVVDGDMGPMQSSPLGDMRESRNSTPPHSLPDFHDIPPPPQRPFFPPPPGHHPRYQMPPPYRREFAPGQKRTDNQSDTSSMGRGTQPTPSSQENWSHNSRV